MKYRGKRAPTPKVACDLMFDFELIFVPDVRVRITVRVGVGLRLESGLE